MFIIYDVLRVCLWCRLYISEERTQLPHLQGYLVGVKLLPYSGVIADLRELVQSVGESKVWINDLSSEIFAQCVADDQRCTLLSPIQLLKAVKNSTEICGMKACHVSNRCGKLVAM